MKLPEEARKIENFADISKTDEEDEHSASYPEDLEIFDVEN